MLSRYTIYRRRPAGVPLLPKGLRQDTRWRTQHILRPTQEMVEAFLIDGSDAAWLTFKREYESLLAARFRNDRRSFDNLVDLATHQDVYLGCSCPTRNNPIWGRCHTFVALEFMRKKYPALDVVIV